MQAVDNFRPWTLAPIFSLDGVPVIEELKTRWRELAEEYERYKHIQIPFGIKGYVGKWVVGAFRTHHSEIDNRDMQVKREAVGSLFPNGGQEASDEAIDAAYRQFWELRMKRNRSCCPLITSILDPLYPDACITYLYSTLEPGSRIGAHRGTNTEAVRVHMCLKEAPDCWMTVEYERRTWRNGEAWAFADASLHAAENNGTADRAIVICDFPKSYLEAELRKLG